MAGQAISIEAGRGQAVAPTMPTNGDTAIVHSRGDGLFSPWEESLRAKLALMSVLLVLALGATVFAAVATFRSFQSVQAQNAKAKAGDVGTIGSWMTIPYISHVYHVPESYLYHSLNLPGSVDLRHKTLHSLSATYKRPVNELVHDIQVAIVAYRREHPPTQHGHVALIAIPLCTRSPSTGRKEL